MTQNNIRRHDREKQTPTEQGILQAMIDVESMIDTEKPEPELAEVLVSLENAFTRLADYNDGK